jgi:hypothetical protein
VSNFALEYQLRILATNATLTDAIGYCYQQDGHVFYVLTFPAGDQTWVYDMSTEEWHQRGWTDAAGVLHRVRDNCFAFINNTPVVGDWQNGTIYKHDLTSYADTVDGTSYPVQYTRTFPHNGMGEINLGQPNLARQSLAASRLMKYNRFALDIDCGNAALVNGLPPTVTLRWSNDRGHTFGTDVLQSMGAPGEYSTQPAWTALGQARDMVFEVSYTTTAEAALSGAWVDVDLGTQ